VVVHWDGHQIPFIAAESDADLAVALGVIHVHLRSGQMEMARRISQGRLSELVGPLGIEIDHALRILGFGRAAGEIAAILPDETRRWIGAFLCGVNHAVERMAELPWEFRKLGLRREAWELPDVLALARVAAAGVTWLTWLGLLGQSDPSVAFEVWRRLVGFDPVAEASPGRSGPAESAGLAATIRSFLRMGNTNSMAVSAAHSASGGAWLASDPHLAVTLPNLWLTAGYKSPSFHLVGLMIPGLPFVAMGRNPWIAWGGTNLHAASSDLFDVSGLAPAEIKERRERIRVRGWLDREIAIRDTAYGPIISDAPFLGRSPGRAYALRWVGHMPSDEITAMLRVNRARNWGEFRAALDLIAVPGQNLIYADAQGHIGKAMAARLPRRPPAPPAEPILPPNAAAHWQSFLTAADLPALLDPDDGFVASANEKPTSTPVPVGYVFSPRGRIDRLNALLGPGAELGFSDLAALQRDVAAPSALAFRDDLARLLRALPQGGAGEAGRLLRELVDWDGRYAEGSRGALAFELLIFHLGVALCGRQRLRLYSRMWDARGLLHGDIAKARPARIAGALKRAVPATVRDLEAHGVWGTMHRLGLPHFLAATPLIGRQLRFGDWAVAGSSETVMKTAHPLTDRRHFTNLAATARQISDLSDLDRNYFVLLGGQDGWLGSTTFLDQAPLWQRGEFIQLPLRPETIRARFPFKTEFVP